MDDRTGDELMRRSVLGGSAIGVLLSLRSGAMDRQLAQATCPLAAFRMPLTSCWTRRSKEAAAPRQVYKLR